ncbi:MAG: cation-translocating P-type ATPase [Caldilineaceae bacterium]
MTWHTDSLDRVLSQLSVDPDAGLDTAEAERRHAETGPNQLVERGVKSRWAILLDQFKDAMVIILLVAAAISLALGEFLDAIVILIIVIVNAIIGFTQEYRAEQAMEALKKMAVPTVRVRRNGGHIEEIPSPALVPGDIVLLEAGNLIPADGRIVESINLKVEEAALTGESEPVNKKAVALDDANLQVGDRINMLYMGTVVTYGRGSFVVTETGMTTELGKIAEMIQDVEQEQTPLQRRLTQLGKMLALAAMAIIAVVIVLGYIDGRRAGHVDWEILFLTGVSMAVAAIPESLPAVVTITLALGAQRLLKRHALMRRLPAVETLGSVTVICSDKTGTLTENRMTVTLLDVAGNTEEMETLQERRGRLRGARLINDASPTLAALSVLIRAGALCNGAVLERDNEGNTRAIGDPTEAALVLAAEQLGWEIKDLRAEMAAGRRGSFTSERKRMTTIHHMSHEVRESDSPIGEAPYIFYTKGAVDSLLDIASGVLVDKEVVPLDGAVRSRILRDQRRICPLRPAGARRVAAPLVRRRAARRPRRHRTRRDLHRHGGHDGPAPARGGRRGPGGAAGRHPPHHDYGRPPADRGAHRPGPAHHRERKIRARQRTGRHVPGPDQGGGGRRLHLRPGRAGAQAQHRRSAPGRRRDRGHDRRRRQRRAGAQAGRHRRGHGHHRHRRLQTGGRHGAAGRQLRHHRGRGRRRPGHLRQHPQVHQVHALQQHGRTLRHAGRAAVGDAAAAAAAANSLDQPGHRRPAGLALAVEPGERRDVARAPYRPTESVFSRHRLRILWIGARSWVWCRCCWAGYWRMDPDGPWQTMVFTTLTLAQMGNALAHPSQPRFALHHRRLLQPTHGPRGAAHLRPADSVICVPFLQRIFRTEALIAPEPGHRRWRPASSSSS